jgi:hypothetical protein
MMGLRAFLTGLGSVIRAPFTVAAVVALTVVTAIPFGLVMGARLQTALNVQSPIALGAEEIDADWWLEFRRQAKGLDATFTPAIIGFAAPLSNLSAVLDGTTPPAVMAVPAGIAIVVWAFIWGWAIERFRTGGSSRASQLWRAGLARVPRFIGISVAALAVQVVLYLTVHAVLFGPVFAALTGGMTSERNAFAVRVILYLIFGALAATVSLVADYARISSAIGSQGWREGLAFVRRWWPSVATLFLVTTVLLGLLMLTYGVGDAYGGSRVAGWRGVVIGQTFVIVRLVMRLVTIAAEVRLFERLSPRS